MTPVPYRTGVPTLQKLALQLCKYLTKFGPILRLVYPSNTTLLAALTAAEAACHELEQELAMVRDYGD